MLRDNHTAVDAALVARCQVVVATVPAKAELLRLSQLCRDARVPLVCAHARGWFAHAFADFGERWESAAPRGDASVTCLVESITRDCPAAVTVVDEQRHHLATGAPLASRPWLLSHRQPLAHSPRARPCEMRRSRSEV